MALGSIGGIVVKVSADTAQFTRGMNRVGSKITANAKKLRQSSMQYQKWASVGAAAATAIGVAMVKSQLTQLDVLAKTSDALKINQKNLQALQHQASLTGTSASQLANNIEKMQRRIGAVARSGGPAADALEEIGINAKEIVSLSADQQVVKIAQAMNGMENASIRASIAMDLFGRDGVRMLKMLEQLKGDGLQSTVEELENLGIALNRIDTAKVEQANDAMFKSQQVVEGIVNKVAVKVSPILEAMANGFLDTARESKGFGDSVDSAMTKSLKVIGVFADGLHGINIVFKSLKVAAFGIGLAVNEAFRIMAKGVEGFINLAIFNVNGMISAINMIPGIAIPAIEKFESAAANMMKGFSDKAKENLTGSITDLHDAMMEPLPSSVLDQFVTDAQAASLAIAEAATAGGLGDGGAVGMTTEERTALNAKLEAIRESLKTERQLKDDAFALDIEAIRTFGTTSEAAKAEADALEIARKQQHANDLFSIEQEAADARKRLAEAEHNAKVQMAAGAFSDLSSLMNTENRKMFKVGKIAAIASAGIAGAQSAIQAWRSGMETSGPWAPVVAAGYAAASLAKTGALISNIKSQSFGGGGGNATSFSGGLPAVNTQQQGQQQNQNINISGIDSNSLISGGQLVSTLNAALGDGYTINFAGG